MKSIKLAVPIITFLVVSLFLFKGLFSDPTNIENVSVDRPFPEFKLHGLMDENRFYQKQDLLGEPILINVWGTWCVTCRVELPFLTELKQKHGVKVVGVYYENAADVSFGDVDLGKTQQEVVEMLAVLGNPFAFNIYDGKRDLALDLGVTGAPEHFLVDKDGYIRWHRRGDINERVWQSELAPLYQSLLTQHKPEVVQ